MLALNVCFLPSFAPVGRKRCGRWKGVMRAVCTAGLAASLLGLLPSVDAAAQDSEAAKGAVPAAPQSQAPSPAQPTLNFRERPKYPTDPQRLRRTVQIDGVLSDGEWDPFYTVTEGPIKGTVYCNWDDNYLYLAARTDQPASVLFDLDMGGDGWLRSADNLEVVIGSIGEGSAPTVAARLLDAANSKDTPVWNDKAVDVKSLPVAGKLTNGTQVVELAIPKDTASLVLRPGATIGVRAEFLPPGPATAYIPTQAFEPHLLLDATLAESRVQPVAGINPRLTLSDYKCIAGQKLFATLELLNQRDVPVPIRSVLWTGQGNSVNVVNTVREVTVPPIAPSKRLKLKYSTVLPPTLAPGSYTLMVTADLEEGKQVQSAATFTIVEPVQAQMSAEPEPVAVVGSTKLRVNVDVFSAVPRYLGGSVELLSVPAGWELKGSKKRELFIDHEDGQEIIRYDFRLPSTTPAGDYPLEAAVNWQGRVWKLKHVVHVVRPEETSPAKTEAKK